MEKENFDTCRHCGDAIYWINRRSRGNWWSTDAEVGGLFCPENIGEAGIMGFHAPGGDATTTARIRARDLIRELEQQVGAVNGPHAAYAALSALRNVFGVKD